MIEKTQSTDTAFSKMFEKAIKIRREIKEIEEKQKLMKEEWHGCIPYLRYFAETCAFLHGLEKTDEEICQFLDLTSDDWEIINEVFSESTRRPGEVSDIQSVFEDIIESRVKSKQ